MASKKKNNKSLVLNTTKESILVIDDQPDALNLLKHLLSGYTITTATTGREGITKAKEIKPDLILLDVMMPDINGFDVCERLKNDTDTADIPIIFVTAKVFLNDIVKGLELGANDYITKPFELSELTARVKTQLELRKAHQKIKEQYLKAVSLNEDKNKFIELVAHDLKNPLKVIQGFVGLIKKRYDSLSKSDIDEYLNDIENASNTMLYIISDVLLMNDIDEGNFNLFPQKFDLCQLINMLIDKYKFKAKSKNVQILFPNSKKEISLFNDLSMTQIIFDNLLSNAIKFTKHSSKITIELKDNENIHDNSNCIEFVIIDEGDGIPNDEIQYIFDKFCKISSSRTNEDQSSGLGLAISKSLCEILGFKIFCSKTDQNGSIFNVILYDMDINNQWLNP